ncbi:hypothetical protein Cni_G10949 [Canna indica]|uniref:Uncharacterized protein n=1 Tax=Canna indica TaxID=4628 RepID=A0AAQ3K5E5_9LILI|nr:hypothetical protein Cni_G10949 [Canna indica]
MFTARYQFLGIQRSPQQRRRNRVIDADRGKRGEKNIKRGPAEQSSRTIWRRASKYKKAERRDGREFDGLGGLWIGGCWQRTVKSQLARLPGINTYESASLSSEGRAAAAAANDGSFQSRDIFLALSLKLRQCN